MMGASLRMTGTMSMTKPVTASRKTVITSMTAAQRGILPRQAASKWVTAGLSAYARTAPTMKGVRTAPSSQSMRRTRRQ